jgi:hypothetical protein
VLRFVRQFPDRATASRREFLRLGGLMGLGLFASSARATSAATAIPGFGRARSVLIVYTSGGMSQLDTWDPKPDAPEEVRGAFSTIPTRIPGLRFSEHLPRLARLTDRCTLVRSLSHDDTDHGSATYLALTGHFHARKSSNPLPRPTDLPTYGSIVQRIRPGRSLPFSAVHINGPVIAPEIPAPGQFAGLIGRPSEPLTLGDVTHGAEEVADLEARPDLPTVRIRQRESLLQSVDGFRRELARTPAALDMSAMYRSAYAFLDSPVGRQAFDLSREPAALRERYGLYRSGQACLLARRLVEAGVPYICVFFNHTIRGQDRDPDSTDQYGWDTHNDIFESLRDHLLPRFDQSFATLLLDLEQRGLLEQTLVLCIGEFGRAPLVAREPGFAGVTPGRKHWASVYSALLAGAGVARGGLIGASDRISSQPRTRPIPPWDIAATLFHSLGIDPAGHFHDPENRPYVICTGQPVRELFE